MVTAARVKTHWTRELLLVPGDGAPHKAMHARFYWSGMVAADVPPFPRALWLARRDGRVVVLT